MVNKDVHKAVEQMEQMFLWWLQRPLYQIVQIGVYTDSHCNMHQNAEIWELNCKIDCQTEEESNFRYTT